MFTKGKKVESKRRIIISSGYHATNIGNAFYDLGATYVLKKTIGDYFEIILSSDKMSLYWNRIVGTNSFDHTLFYNADYLILMGPVFSANYIKMWASTFERLKTRGTKLVFMSAGGETYDDCERREVTEYLKKIKPYALLSRDRETFDTYNSFF